MVLYFCLSRVAMPPLVLALTSSFIYRIMLSLIFSRLHKTIKPCRDDEIVFNMEKQSRYHYHAMINFSVLFFVLFGFFMLLAFEIKQFVFHTLLYSVLTGFHLYSVIHNYLSLRYDVLNGSKINCKKLILVLHNFLYLLICLASLKVLDNEIRKWALNVLPSIGSTTQNGFLISQLNKHQEMTLCVHLITKKSASVLYLTGNLALQMLTSFISFGSEMYKKSEKVHLISSTFSILVLIVEFYPMSKLIYNQEQFGLELKTLYTACFMNSLVSLVSMSVPKNEVTTH